MSKETQVLTGLVRFSYANIWEPRQEKGEGKVPKYSCAGLIPVQDKETIKKIKAAIKAAYDDGVVRLWGNKKPRKWWNPLQDGDDKEEEPAYHGKMYINAKNKSKPGIVDENVEDIIDPDECQSGDYGRMSVEFFPYLTDDGVKGVSCSLLNIQKLQDGERFGATKTSAAEDFADDFDGDFWEDEPGTSAASDDDWGDEDEW